VATLEVVLRRSAIIHGHAALKQVGISCFIENPFFEHYSQSKFKECLRQKLGKRTLGSLSAPTSANFSTAEIASPYVEAGLEDFTPSDDDIDGPDQ
jgi:hypothetical protein